VFSAQLKQISLYFGLADSISVPQNPSISIASKQQHLYLETVADDAPRRGEIRRRERKSVSVSPMTSISDPAM